MKALILAAEARASMSSIKPTALIEVGGKPMLEHVILKLKTAGFDRIVINVHHLGEQIISFLEANNHFGVRIDISDERDYLLDTGGGIKNAARFFQGDEPFLIHNVDIFSNVNFQDIYTKHKETNPLATLLVSKRKTSRHLLFNKENHLCGWRNHETGEIKSHYPDFDPKQYEEYAFGGIHVVSPKIFEWMDEWTGKFSVINFYLAVCAKTTIQAYQPEELQLIDIDQPEALAKAEEWIKSALSE
ncbi:sugar phosphate nucleotidyltransferase [Parabacteroides sp. PF5-9]|uniref:sugar phosphate nucleotidyltransferase n=1 Tax=Parabacteroides sp. PF5-9 TaxID=1742404 RepID=UPI0024741E8B|nr:sugar phosphate nucleotidyltransferase [Parabacteroides sp. PF5-9]MDH6358633.1 MurNAc alpha-1-phosphate uridylyltransferase [Parabacteroides sp. PF5-9]